MLLRLCRERELAWPVGAVTINMIYDGNLVQEPEAMCHNFEVPL